MITFSRIMSIYQTFHVRSIFISDIYLSSQGSNNHFIPHNIQGKYSSSSKFLIRLSSQSSYIHNNLILFKSSLTIPKNNLTIITSRNQLSFFSTYQTSNLISTSMHLSSHILTRVTSPGKNRPFSTSCIIGFITLIINSTTLGNKFPSSQATILSLSISSR